MIYITGDTHGDFKRVEAFCTKVGTTSEDLLIILGDVGINYYGGKKDSALKDRLSKLPITLFCIKGNHENYAGNIKSYNLIDSKYGKVYVEQDYPNLLFAKDGEIYDFGGKKAIVIGGAYSVDKFYRLAMGYRWFNDEQPSEEVKAYVEAQLDKLHWDVDLVLSHTCPIRYEPREWFLSQIDQNSVDKTTEEWLDYLFSRLMFDKWYCGHYHGEKVIDNMVFLYNSIDSIS